MWLLVVESGTRDNCLLTVCYLFVESGTYDVICQFCTFKGMVVESSEVLKAQNCALSKFSFSMHCNEDVQNQNIGILSVVWQQQMQNVILKTHNSLHEPPKPPIQVEYDFTQDLTTNFRP